MPRRSHLRIAALTAANVVGVTILNGCQGAAPDSGPVAIATFTPTHAAVGPCRAIMKALPATVKNQPRTPSTGSPYGAAWGRPAITLRCGVPEPAGADSQAICLTVNGVDWYLSGQVPSANDADPTKTLTVTTMYRSPAIEVTVPNSYGTQGPSTTMAQLTAVITAHTTVSNHCS